MEPQIILQISVAIVAATMLGFLAKLLKQPVILAYIIAGVVLGQSEGLGWLSTEQLEPISELGLILLLFMIGLEIDLRKLKNAGPVLITAGLVQFPICLALGLVFFPLIGFHSTPGQYAPLYLAVGMALSSTMIVVKLLYDKRELDTIPGRLTLGILVFQDIWAILFLALQHDLKNPAIGLLALSIVKGAGIVLFSLLVSRFVLPFLFRWVAKTPELVLMAALGWCFGVVLLASWLGLSREMGALIAGVSLSTFPYNLDVVAKIISLRDFFITLFFIALGTKIPRPTPELLALSLAASAFLVVSRFLAVSPVLHAFKLGNRVSFVPALNLAQISEFSLVICAVGVSLRHIDERVLAVVVLTLVITSVLSTYGIEFNHQIYLALAPLMERIGLRDLSAQKASAARPMAKSLFLLGFSRHASSLLLELLDRDPRLAGDIAVVDFNPEVKQELDRRQICCIYGDISHNDTLHHANIHTAQVVVSTIPDHILKGTSNGRLLRQASSLSPRAQVFVTAEVYADAQELYEDGAAFVFFPRLMGIRELADAVMRALQHDLEEERERAQAEIGSRQQLEVLP